MSDRLKGSRPPDPHALRQICGGSVNSLGAAIIVFV
jgi:hypothetical protein